VLAVLLVILLLPGASTAADRDCSDFATQQQAQKFFEAHGGLGQDPDRLDGTEREARPVLELMRA
jgi:hypothetical protein